MEMATEQRGKTLPEELVEKIIAMMPFPSLFKARGLSKSWLSRFSPISSQGDEVKKRAATSFQKQVRERSKTWGSFFPVCFDKDFVCAYHQASQTWVKLPSLSFLPEELLKTGLSDIWIEGALLVNVDQGRQIYVANIFTRSWKELPAPPNVTTKTPVFSPVSFRDTSRDTCEAIFFRTANPLTVDRSALIYESKSDQWSSGTLVGGGNMLGGSPAYLNGIVYLATHDSDDLYLQAFNVEEGTSEGGQLSFKDIVVEIVEEIYLVVCNAQLLMIVHAHHLGTVHVLKIDLVSRELFEVGRCPRALNSIDSFSVNDSVAPASDGTHIFFRVYNRAGGLMVAYNVQADEWRYMDFTSTVNEAFNRTALQWLGCSFQPGLNPFAEI